MVIAFQSSPILNLPRAAPGSRAGLLLVTANALDLDAAIAEAGGARQSPFAGASAALARLLNRLDMLPGMSLGASCPSISDDEPLVDSTYSGDDVSLPA
jgi:hypothetical protein